MADRRGKEGPIGTSSTTARLAQAGSPRPWAILATARSLKGAAPAPCMARSGRDVDAVVLTISAESCCCAID
jgi:hypothetical protein